MNSAAHIEDTAVIWKRAHNALLGMELVKAHQALSDLCRKSGVGDYRLMDIEEYEQIAGQAIPEGFRHIISDRLELWNSKVEA